MTAPLQARVANWHRARFPDCTVEDVALKAASEVGEVADAVLGAGRDASHPERGTNLAAECADVLVCLFALCGRFTYNDLIAETEAKLRLLETPGAHPASVPDFDADPGRLQAIANAADYGVP